MDDLTSAQRHKNMSHIRSIDSKPEVIVRKYLFSKGLRYRKNVKNLAGKPDIVLRKYNTVIFVNGCFWHQHPNCKYAVIPTSHQDYWIPKLCRNVERDKKNQEELEKQGWKVIIVWECQLKKSTRDKTLNDLYKNVLL